MLADPTSGLSPVLQDFFQTVHDLTGNPNGRGALLSSAQSLAGRFQSMDGQLRDLRAAVNGEVSTTITAINSYAQQIADLNDAVANAKSGSGQLPNDLMDQRDYLVSELSKLTKVKLTKDGNSYNVFIGSGQPVVVGNTLTKLVATSSPTDLSEITVGMVTGTGTIRLSESNLQGGKLGGLLDFRATTLTKAQNDLGRIALGLATTFNDQHRLGKDTTGAMGGNFFGMASPVVNTNSLNTGTGVLGATVTDVNALKSSDYKVAFDGVNYNVTRLSDKKQMYSGAAFPNAATLAALTPSQTSIDGLNFTLTPTPGPMLIGDSFIVKPTINAASGFAALITDPNNIAAAAPITTSAPMTNIGSGVISGGSIDKNFLPAMVAPAVTLRYDAAAKEFNSGAPGTGFPFSVKVTTSSGTSTIYPAGTPVPYTPGTTITFGAALAGPPADVGGVSVSISGVPGDSDQFVIGTNTALDGDSRNMGLLAKLQTTDTLIGGTANYQDALADMVSAIGSKTHELEVGNEAQSTLVGQLQQAQDMNSGVNLDEEGANLLRYQQAYVAAGKVMQAVKEMFDALVSIGR
jgi:flagellar hook-associated protein 1 FlgK